MKYFVYSLLFLFVLNIQAQEKITSNDVDRLMEYMSGKFNSSLQAENDKSYYNIQLVMIPIWKSKKEHWLYVEQAMATKPNQPYRQRLYKISKYNDTTITSEVYELKDPKQYIGKWKKPKTFDTLRKSNIVLREGCAIYLTKTDKNTFKGSTHKKECKSDLRGASYATSKVEITPEKLTSWDRGYNDSDKQVWGAKAGAYIFIKLESYN